MDTEVIAPAEPVTASVALADRPCTAELAECTCPEFCERDHEND